MNKYIGGGSQPDLEGSSVEPAKHHYSGEVGKKEEQRGRTGDWIARMGGLT